MTVLTDVHLVSHTHWDREWYHSFEQFRSRLIRLIDELLDDPPPAGFSFLLDGQAIILEDYLAVRPDRLSQLQGLLADQRLEAGPWYVLPDELIPGGEALVRNLLMGRRVLRSLNSEAPPVLYCPDSFGHPAVLPDIAHGFGCKTIVLWRGLSDRATGNRDVARWIGAAGNIVLVYHLPPDGYEFGSSLPSDAQSAADRWTQIRAVLEPRSGSGHTLLLNGADHHARQRHLNESIRALRAVAHPVRIHLSSLGNALGVIGNAAELPGIETVRGELRDSYGYAWTLQGTFGTRAAQKRANAVAERTLLRDVEPWLAIAGGRDGNAERALLRAAWKTLLQNHPHDTLCGTSIDAVGRAFDHRAESVAVQSTELRTQAISAVMRHDAETARSTQQDWKPMTVIRNPCARPRRGIVELKLQSKIADVAVGPGSASRQGERAKPPSFAVSGMKLQVLARHETVALTESDRSYPDADRVLQVQALGWIESLGGYAIETRAHDRSAPATVKHRARATQNSLENGLVSIKVGDNGQVTFTDHALQRTINDLFNFEQARDAGDLYTPAIRERFAPPKFVRTRVLYRGPLRAALALEFRSKSRTTIRLVLSVDANSNRIGLAISGNNRDADQRLRLIVRSKIPLARTLADAAFHPVERAALELPDDCTHDEMIIPTAPVHRWIARFGEQSGLLVISDGLAEYESLMNGDTAFTLLRSVGTLSRVDLPERPGHVGWPRDTPEARCLGKFEARYFVAMLGPDSAEVRQSIENQADDALTPIVGNSLRSNLLAPHVSGGLELSGDALAFAAAMPAQEDGWIVLRCVNRENRAVRGVWRLSRSVVEAFYARLDEMRLARVHVSKNEIQFSAEPMEIVTILARYSS